MVVPMGGTERTHNPMRNASHYFHLDDTDEVTGVIKRMDREIDPNATPYPVLRIGAVNIFPTIGTLHALRDACNACIDGLVESAPTTALDDAVHINNDLTIFLTDPDGQVSVLFGEHQGQSLRNARKIATFLRSWVEHANRQHVETR